MYTRIKSEIDSLADKSTVFIFLHHNADPDALCSGEGLKSFIHFINPNHTVVLLTDSLNVSSARIAKEKQIQFLTEIDTQEDPQLIITVDTANFSQLGKFEGYVKTSNTTKIVIDHHEQNDLINSDYLVLHEMTFGSTSLIIAKLFETCKIVADARTATILLSGHLYDSRRFMHGAIPEAFRLTATLIENGGDYRVANDLLQNQMSLGERIARIKASRRITYRTIKAGLIAASRVSAFEASAARSLIAMGCDVVLVLAKKENEIRGSARTAFSQNLHIADLVSKLAVMVQTEFSDENTRIIATSGGHKNAAGINIQSVITNKQIQRIIDHFLDLVENALLVN